MNIKKLNILVVSFICSVVFFEAAWAQEELRNFAEGLPALTIKSNSDTALNRTWSNLVYQNNNCLINTQASYGNPTNPSQSSIDSYSTVFNLFYNDPDVNRDQ